MRSVALILFTFVFSLCNTIRSPNLKISHLTGDFYVYTTYKPVAGNPFPSNSMYLVTDDGIVLFDTPWDATQFQPLLDSIESRHHKKVTMCIATHFHDDRTAGLEFFAKKGISTYSTKQTYDLGGLHHEKQAQFYFTKDTVFTFGTHQFRTFYPGEGHTKDNIVIWFDKEKILYGGCLVKSTENSGLGNTTDANLKSWPRSIKKVMKEFPDPEFVIPGHFGWTDKSSLIHTLKRLKKHKKG